MQVEDLDFSSLLHCVVEVEDYNDHAPVFIPHFISLGPLPEDITMGTSIARLAASDSDSGQNRDLTYSLLDESDPDGMFVIDQAGVVTVARPLDREASSQHHLIVIATDHGIPPLTGSATVQLSLLDVNDNGPEFEAVYAPVVYENVFGPQVGTEYGWIIRIYGNSVVNVIKERRMRYMQLLISDLLSQKHIYLWDLVMMNEM